jgi:hypothetical protein
MVRKSGKLNLDARRNRRPKAGSRMFSTGPQATSMGIRPASASGARIFGDVRRALLFAVVLVAVGIILAEFVKML